MVSKSLLKKIKKMTLGDCFEVEVDFTSSPNVHVEAPYQNFDRISKILLAPDPVNKLIFRYHRSYDKEMYILPQVHSDYEASSSDSSSDTFAEPAEAVAEPAEADAEPELSMLIKLCGGGELDGGKLHLKVRMTDDVESVLNKISDVGQPVDCMMLFHHKLDDEWDVQLMQEWRTLSHYKIDEDSKFTVYFTKPTSQPATSDEEEEPSSIVEEPAVTSEKQYLPYMQIFVKDWNGKSHRFDMHPNDPVLVLKAFILRELSIPYDKQYLIFGGKKLEETLTMAHYNIQKESTIHLTSTLLGSGKRASSRGPRSKGKNFSDREEIIIDTIAELETSLPMANVPNIRIFQDSHDHIKAIVDKTKASSTMMTTILNTFDRDDLCKVQKAFESTNNDHKYSVLRGVVFKSDCENLRRLEAQSLKMKSLMMDALQLAMIANFSNEAGDVSWEAVRDEIDTIKAEMDKQSGIKLAEAKAKAKDVDM
jgi:ubiquitin-large subunit ribosomal protein L40e